MTYGVFINYKHTHKHLAGRIYDFFVTKGAGPFMDDYAMNQDRDYRERLLHEVRNAPYFLCLLTEDAVEELCTLNDSSDNEENIYFEEIKTAFESARKILVLTYGNINYDVLKKLPESISGIKYINHYKIPEENRLFYNVMDNLCTNDVDDEVLKDVVSWRGLNKSKANVLISSRKEIEEKFGTYNMIFGTDYITAIMNNAESVGMNRVKEINLVCYAATAVLCNNRQYIDRLAYDHGVLFKIFSCLLKDQEFSLRLVINAPLSSATADTIRYSKLGNSAFAADDEEQIFLNSYASIAQLIHTEPYETAHRLRRFSFLVTDCALPYAMFQVVYKKGFEEYNHIKIDLYSCGIDTTKERRSMLIFERDNVDNYNFFNGQIKLFNNGEARARSKQMIEENHRRWIEAWDVYVASTYTT